MAESVRRRRVDNEKLLRIADRYVGAYERLVDLLIPVPFALLALGLALRPDGRVSRAVGNRGRRSEN